MSPGVRVVLLGDSHLALLGAHPPALGEVLNAARGGATAADLLPQLVAAVVGADDVVVLSVGTNDAFPLRGVTTASYGAHLDAFAAACPARTVLVDPPGVDEALLGPGDRTNAVIERYAATARERLPAAAAVPTAALLAPLGTAAFLDDGLHLTPAAYDVLLPAVRAAVRATAEQQDAPPPRG